MGRKKTEGSGVKKGRGEEEQEGGWPQRVDPRGSGASGTQRPSSSSAASGSRRASSGGSGRTTTYKCPYCEKKFGRRYNKEIHIRVHTGDEPYICGVDGCPLSFKWRSTLINHHPIIAAPESSGGGIGVSSGIQPSAVPSAASGVPGVAAGTGTATGGPVSKLILPRDAQITMEQPREREAYYPDIGIPTRAAIPEMSGLRKCPYEGCGKVFVGEQHLQEHMKEHELTD